MLYPRRWNYSSFLPNYFRIIYSRRTEWVGLASRMAETRNTYRILFGERRERKLLERPAHR
jgi:hypothetical protein